MSCEIGLELNQLYHLHSSIHSFLSLSLVSPMSQNHARVSFLCPSLFSSTTSPLRARFRGRMSLYLSMTSFPASRYSKAFPLICPDVSGNFVFSHPNVPS